jgi:hypothetical protein
MYRKTKFTSRSILETEVGDDGKEMYYLHTSIVEVCAICGGAFYDQLESIVLEEDVMKFGKWYYIVFEEHESCRELAAINPLAYLEHRGMA